MKTRICVIGAGPAGLSTLYQFHKIVGDEPQRPDVVCYEKQEDWCGMWNYSWKTGVDEYGEPVHHSMYRYLWSNGPKELNEYADYTFQEHFGKPTPAFTPRIAMRDYFEGRFSKADIKRHILFNHSVKRVVFDKQEQLFRIDVKNLKDDCLIENEQFSHVVVCSSHYSFPHLPDIPGLNLFEKSIIHCHDIRDFRCFTNQKVLVVGGSFSGQDIALQCYKFGCRNIYMSIRKPPSEFKWPEGIVEKPLIDYITGTEVVFIDKTKIEIDSIILCTGYIHHYPFLMDELRLKSNTSPYPLDLYEGMLWMKGGDDKLFYIGAQKSPYVSNLFDLEAIWCLQVILGMRELPSRQDREKSIAEWRKRNDSIKTVIEEITFNEEHMNHLAKEVNFPHEVDAHKLAMELFSCMTEDMLTYRDSRFASMHTGILSASVKKPFMEEFNDSLQHYVS